MANVPETDDRRLFLLLLRRTELDEEEAYTAVQEIQSMAAANLIGRFEAKLDALNVRLDAAIKAQSAELDAGLKVQNAELRAIRWVLGLGMVSLGVLLTALRVFG